MQLITIKSTENTLVSGKYYSPAITIEGESMTVSILHTADGSATIQQSIDIENWSDVDNSTITFVANTAKVQAFVEITPKTAIRVVSTANISITKILS